MPNAMITLVHAPACHFCDDAQKSLAELSELFPITVELVGVESPEGEELVGEYRPAMFPLVLLDGELFSVGRLPRRKLRALLEKRTVGSPT
jgi:hypothetical protein